MPFTCPLHYMQRMLRRTLAQSVQKSSILLSEPTCRGVLSPTTVRERLRVIRDHLAGSRSDAETGRKYARDFGPFLLWLSLQQPQVWQDVQVRECPASEENGVRLNIEILRALLWMYTEVSPYEILSLGFFQAPSCFCYTICYTIWKRYISLQTTIWFI